MAVDSTITTVLRYFLDRKSEKRERIADYLDEVADDARVLAEIWREILASYNEGINDPYSDKELKRIIDKVFGPSLVMQTYRFSKLKDFYFQISKIIGGRTDSEFQNDFMDSLGALIQHRTLARQEAAAIFAESQRLVFLSEENSTEELKNLERVVVAIQREAAALEVLAKTYRASI